MTGDNWVTDPGISTVSEVGKARLPREDERFITGRTNWTDNITLPGLTYVAFVRSPYAHARITGVDVSAAREASGVIAVYSGADFAAEQGSLPCAWPVTEDIVIPDHPPMAVDTVRYAGEIVACVVARDRYAAADALELVEVSYDPLEPVLDMESALAEGSIKVHDAGNKSYTWTLANGDMDAAFRHAPVVIERTYRQQRLIPSAMEPRAVVCAPVGNEYTMWSSTQIPHVLKVMLALVTGISEQQIRVIAPDVGGGFGSKLQVTAEEVLALLLARKLGRPVKWTESRSEGNVAVHHGRDQIQRLRLAADADGRIRGLDVDLLADMGAYLMLVTPGVPLLGAFMFNAIYKMDAYRFNCTGVFTTKTPTDAYCGAGRPEATYAIERLLDDLAAELGMDPLQLRERNWIKHEEFPYTTIAGLTYDSGNYEAATAAAKELFHYDELRAEQRARRETGDPVQLGIGASTFTEMCGLAPSRVLGSLRYAAGGWGQVSIRMLPTGKVEVATGTALGQGFETAWSQIVADELGVPFEDIRVLHGDTQIMPTGMDTYGSASLVVGGAALVNASGKVRQKARVITAAMLEVSPDDLEWDGGRWVVRGHPDQGKTIGEVALATFAAHNLPDGVEPSLDSDASYHPDNFSFPHGTHLCAVEVDTQTGHVTIRAYVAVDDFGVVVNPLIVEGRVQGGIAQGIAQALYEEAIYDSSGNLITASLADYLVPSAADLPHLTTARTTTPSTLNPLGVKGVGEAGAIASTPAVVNAIIDALRPLGITDITMPCTPQRVWRAIQAGRSASLPSLPPRSGNLEGDDGSADVTLNLEEDDGPARVYVRGRMEPELVVDQPSTVEVVVASEPIHHAERPTDRSGQAPVVTGQALLVEIAGRANLEVSGQDRIEIPVPAPGEPRFLLFEVRATHQGDGELWVIVRQGPLPLLTLVLRPSIHQSPPGVGEARLEATGQTLVGPSPAPLTVLRVFEQRHGEAVVYLYELDAPELQLTRPYASRLIEQDRDAYVRGLFARIEQVWADSDEDTAAFQEQLRAFGGQLLDELVPLELQRDLWNLRDQLAHIVVLSTEPFIPWELVHLKDPDAGHLPAEICFLAQLGLVRWLWQPQTPGRYCNVRLPERLQVRPGRARYVIPAYPDPGWQLPAATVERAFLEHYLDAASVTPHHAEVLALLRDPSGPEGFDLLHFAGHGQAMSDNIADAQLLLEGRMERGRYRSEPLRVTVAAQNFHVTTQPGPVVVLNACQVGRLGHQLASIGGFAQAFLGGGASAFISGLWSLGDAPAGVFIQLLYQRLLCGATMAEAVKTAREAARECGDATWLAYTVYAHPGARLQGN